MWLKPHLFPQAIGPKTGGQERSTVAMNYLNRPFRTRALLQSGPRMLTGLALAALGAVLSYPVLVGQHGGGLSWWPALVFAGISWFLLGAVRMVVAKLA